MIALYADYKVSKQEEREPYVQFPAVHTDRWNDRLRV